MKNNINIETVGKNYAGLFVAVCRNILEYDKNIDAIVEQERGNSPNKEDYYLATRNARINSEKKIKDIAVGMIERMIWIAQDTFAPEGASLKIDKSEVMEACGYRECNRNGREPDWTEFNASKVWDYLVENYGGNKGEEEGHRQTAAALIDSFHIRQSVPIRMVNGKMILERSVYIDSFDKKWSKKNNISYNCVEGISKSIAALHGFAVWANHDALARSLSVARHQLGDHRSEIVSRAVYGGNGIRIITYLNRYEYQIEAPVAEQLQLFLSLYAFADQLQEAA